MSDMAAQEEWRTMKVRDWLLATLRFAVTLEQTDRDTVLAIAKDMDRSGSRVASTAFAFFIRTSTELCNAIVDKGDPKRVATLRRHLRRIGDHRLRRALEAVIGFGDTCQIVKSANKIRKRGRQDLWGGLRR
jgi:hypothetical protein